MSSKRCSHIDGIGGREIPVGVYGVREREEGKEFVLGTGCIRKALVTGGESMHSKEKEYKIASHWFYHKSQALAISATEEN